MSYNSDSLPSEVKLSVLFLLLLLLLLLPPPKKTTHLTEVPGGYDPLPILGATTSPGLVAASVWRNFARTCLTSRANSRTSPSAATDFSRVRRREEEAKNSGLALSS